LSGLFLIFVDPAIVLLQEIIPRHKSDRTLASRDDPLFLTHPPSHFSITGKLIWYNERIAKDIEDPSPTDLIEARHYLKRQHDYISSIDINSDKIVLKESKSSFDMTLTLIGTIITALGVILTIYLSWRKDLRESKEKIQNLTQKADLS
jgi:hypothetical protein